MKTLQLRDKLPTNGNDAMLEVFRIASVGEFIEWGHRKFNVRFDRASISRQKRGKQSVSIPWQAVYIQFLIDKKIQN